MKKILIFLFILVGCSINTDVENSPIVEELPIIEDNHGNVVPPDDSFIVEEDENTETNEEPNLSDEEDDNNQDVEKYTCKTFRQTTGLPKDHYDYIQNKGCMFNETNGKIYEDKDYVYIEEIGKQDWDYLLQYHTEFVQERNYSTNEYFNWLTSINVFGENTRYKLVLNLKGQQAEEINDFLDFIYTREVPVVESTYRMKQVDDILSVSFRMYHVSHFMEGNLPRPYIFNIDLKTNLAITNKELLDRFNTNFETAQKLVNEQLKELGFVYCKNITDTTENCIFNLEMNPSIASCTAELNEYSYIFIDDEGNLKVIMCIGNTTYNQFEGKPTPFIILDLCE